jgi:hypothetical protein
MDRRCKVGLGRRCLLRVCSRGLRAEDVVGRLADGLWVGCAETYEIGVQGC